MRILDSESMRAVDRRAIEEWGFPSTVLMENAALGVVEAVAAEYAEADRVLIFCGPGNNGGDGLAVARHLDLRGYAVGVVLVGWSKNRSEDADLQLGFCRRAGLAIAEIDSEEDLRAAAWEDAAADLWIDALFGTGLSRPLEGLFAELARRLSDGPVPVVAVDLPSGLDASRGEPIGPAVDADLTVALAAPKRAHVFAPAAESCGRVVVSDLGIPEVLLAEAPGDPLSLLVGDELAAYLLVPRPTDHKGRFGHCLIVAGSRGKAGAAILAARAAVASGAGLVTVGVPAPLVDLVDGASLESMSLPLAADRSGALSVDAASESLAALEGKQALAIGPGLGTRGTTATAVRELVATARVPMVIDADGLNVLAGELELLREREHPTVLTPHPGEAARLFDLPAEEILGSRIEFVRDKASELGVVLVLKGHQTLVGTPTGEVFVNSTGSPAMASGGSGDVLTGMIGALLAQRYDAVVAACLGVFLHGLAGDLAAETNGLEGTRASDVIDALPRAFRSLRRA